MKLDLSKLVLSGNVPVGFRELTADETAQPGDIYLNRFTNIWHQCDFSTASRTPYGKKNAAGDSENGWLPHFRRIGNVADIPATHGQVTAGDCRTGDLQRLEGSGLVFSIEGGAEASSFIRSKIYRFQPAFAVENVTKHSDARYRGVAIPPGFRELNPGEVRLPDTDAIWFPTCCNSKALHCWDFSSGFAGAYDDMCNPTIRRTEPVSDAAPLLQNEEVPVSSSDVNKIADSMGCSEELRSENGALKAGLATQAVTITSYENKLKTARQEIAAQTDRNKALWQANAALLKRSEALTDANLTAVVLRGQKKLLEVELHESKAIAESRRLRIADLECRILKAKQELTSMRTACPPPAANLPAYREIDDNDLLENGDEVSYDGIVWNRFYCGPKARLAFGDFRSRKPNIFRARRKLE